MSLAINISDFNETESKVISWMRFPLAVLVVFVHTPRTHSCLVQWALSDVIASMAVPLFFLLSGYLYFVNITDKTPKSWYWPKTKRRIESVLIPYLFWALLPVLVFIIRKVTGMIIHGHGPEMLFQGLKKMNYYHILWEAGTGGPQNMSLWFLRNLFVLVVFAPLLWFFLKRFKFSCLPVLIAANLFAFWIPFPGFSAGSTLFFSIGAWCAIHHFSMFKISERLCTVSLGLSLSTAILLYFRLIPLYVFNLVTIPLCLSIFYRRTFNRGPAPALIANSSMFIYLAHGYFVESPIVWGGATRILPNSVWGELIGYFIVPLTAIVILVVLNWGLRRIVPRAMKFVCGR